MDKEAASILDELLLLKSVSGNDAELCRKIDEMIAYLDLGRCICDSISRLFPIKPGSLR
jgi:hypothetical protein